MTTLPLPYFLCPYDLPPQLSGTSCLQFLSEQLSQLLDDLLLEMQRKVWVVHDGAPANSSRNVIRYLVSHYPGRWIERIRPIVWPQRSPDLTHVDFCLWDHLKSIVYTQLCITRYELWNAIQGAGTAILNMPDVSQRTRNSWRNRLSCRLTLILGRFNIFCEPLVTG
jgi:hypothetical protein